MKNEFTYNADKSLHKFERYEWDNIWYEHADDEERKKRVLVIGDSISIGVRSNINNEVNDKYYTDGAATAKSITMPVLFFKFIDYIFSMGFDYEIIQFNNGLHGMQIDADEYIEAYKKVVNYIKAKSEAKLILALTTPLTDKEKNKIVIERNDKVKEWAEEEEISVIDFYSLLEGKDELYIDDGVHLKEEGYNLLARECVKFYSEKVGL